MKSNYREFEEVAERAISWGAEGVNLSQYVATGRGCHLQALGRAENRELLETWLLLRKEHPSVQFTAHMAGLATVAPELAAAPGFIGCQAGVHIACITARGDVTPCVMLPLVLGNLRNESFAEVWGSSGAVRRLQSREDLAGACRGCALTEKCGGCRAVAWANNGDLMGEDVACPML